MISYFNKLDRRMLVMCLQVCMLAVMFVEPSFAQDPFAAAEEKADDFLAFLTGKFATVALAIVICIVGFISFKGWISPALGISIATGAILIGSSMHIAAWMVGN